MESFEKRTFSNKFPHSASAMIYTYLSTTVELGDKELFGHPKIVP